MGSPPRLLSHPMARGQMAQGHRVLGLGLEEVSPYHWDHKPHSGLGPSPPALRVQRLCWTCGLPKAFPMASKRRHPRTALPSQPRHPGLRGLRSRPEACTCRQDQAPLPSRGRQSPHFLPGHVWSWCACLSSALERATWHKGTGRDQQWGVVPDKGSDELRAGCSARCQYAHPGVHMAFAWTSIELQNSWERKSFTQ